MRVFRFTHFVVSAFALSFCACTAIYAHGVPPEVGVPKSRECIPCEQHLRDSVFHSYMDSLDYRIHALNDVAHRVDSMAQIFKGDHHWKLFMDGKSFGPIHIPQTHIPSVKLPDLDFETPEVTIPEVNVPAIEIPEIDINMDSVTANLSALENGAARLHDLASEYSGCLSGTLKDLGQALRDGRFIVNGHSENSGSNDDGTFSGTFDSDNMSVHESNDSYYDSKSDMRYFIQNTKPLQKAKRTKSGSNIWLLNAK